MDSGNLLAAVLLVVVLCRRSARPLRNLPVEIFLFQVGHVRPGVGHFTDSPVPGTEPGANAYGVLVDRSSTVQRRRTSFVPGWESFTSTSTPSFYTLTHAENVTADPNYPT